MSVNVNTAEIFSIQSNEQFERLALNIFNAQYAQNDVYRSYVDNLGIDSGAVSSITAIPFIPVSFFKSHQLLCGNGKYDKEFSSSTTTSGIPSRHFVKDISIYETSFRKGFEYFYGNIKECCVLALLPSYLEREDSSLVYMADVLIKDSKNPYNGFYIHEYEKLAGTLKELEQKGQKTLLLGVTYALLKLAEEYPMQLKNIIIMETGGMKGKREELSKNEVHRILQKAFGVDSIHSEYGMTELLSQAYSKGQGVFQCPPWMRLLVRDLNDPFNINAVGSGAINIVDLANIYSCSFIATDDMGLLHKDGSFEITGRVDYSDIRGCNLMAEDL